MPKKLSIVCPVHNEEENLSELIRRIFNGLRNCIDFNEIEIILIDDNSRDKSLKVMNDLVMQFNNINVISHDKRRGQAAAISSGLRAARGEIIITMDSDLQVFPEDLPIFLDKMNDGYQLVNGIRSGRKEILLLRLSSKLFSLLVSILINTRIKDAASNFTAVRKEFINGLNLEGNDHRYIIPIIKRRGATRIIEVNVRHAHRKRGKSKYRLIKLISAVPEFFLFYHRFKRGYYDLN